MSSLTHFLSLLSSGNLPCLSLLKFFFIVGVHISINELCLNILELYTHTRNIQNVCDYNRKAQSKEIGKQEDMSRCKMTIPGKSAHNILNHFHRDCNKNKPINTMFFFIAIVAAYNQHLMKMSNTYPSPFKVPQASMWEKDLKRHSILSCIKEFFQDSLIFTGKIFLSNFSNTTLLSSIEQDAYQKKKQAQEAAVACLVLH